MRTKLLAGLSLAGAGLLLATPVGAAPTQEETVYRADLAELNDSGASGQASITVSADGTSIDVEVKADGLGLDGPHAMHLHGIVEGGEALAATCPTAVDDSDGDGVLTVVEGAPRYGAVQLSLTTEGDTGPESALAVERYPAGTSIDYRRTGIPLPPALQGQVPRLHVVVHGIDENGNGTLDLDQVERSSLTDDLPREGTAPALCGTLTVATDGPVQTGGGGLAVPHSGLGRSSSSSLIAFAGLAAVAVAGTGLVTRRVGGGA